jgi:fibronectin type 3 domain-containing protein
VYFRLFFLSILLVLTSCGSLTKSGSDSSSTPISSISEPKGLVVNIGKVSIQLAWVQSSDASYYEIYRSLQFPVSYQSIAQVRAAGFTDSIVSPNIVYMYKIKAVSSDDVESDFSNSISAIIINTDKPTAPSNLVFTVVDGLIELTFSSASVDVSYFDVYRSLTATDGFVKINSKKVLKENGVSPIRGLFQDTTAVSNQTYFYKIKAIDQAGYVSDFSAVFSGKL